MMKALFLCVLALMTLASVASVSCTRAVQSDNLSSPKPAPKPSSPQYQKITQGFNLDPGSPGGTHIPQGSVIYHWANGITEADKPDGTLFLLAKDSEAATPPNPSGREIPATWIIQYPNGTSIGPDPNNADITRAYLGNKLILTIVSRSDNY